VPRTPAQIQTFLDDNAHRQDMSVQYLGTEPNAERRPWDTATVRWCLMASWPYEAAAGNQSIPAVYKAIHDADPTFLCDRFYLPATPSDLRLLEKNHIPVFGIESKHQLTDFDVIATSISYPVLSMSFIKMLTMSGIPARWKDRHGPADGMGLDETTQCDYPMVIVGGLSYGAPEVLAPVVDCWFLGEAEDEPGNPGIGEVTRRISAFKQLGRWNTDRVGCYADLAREFNFLYFPRFVDVHYQYEDRSHVGVGPRMSKQVTGYASNLPGMRLPFRKRHVRDLDAIPPLDNPPLLYADPAMGSGDLEVARGCPAWCSFCALCLSGNTRFITRRGVVRLDDLVGQTCEVWTDQGWASASVDQYGTSPLNRVVLVPADRGGFGGADVCRYGHPRTGEVETMSHQGGKTAKLTMAKAEEIRTLWATGEVTQGELAARYQVARPQISLIVNGKAWMPNKAKPAVMTDSNCRTCRRVKAKNAYYRKTGRPELQTLLVELDGWGRERGWRQAVRPSMSVEVLATPTHRWPLVDGTETHHLAAGDFVRASHVTQVADQDEADRGFVHGIVFGDGSASQPTQAGLVFSLGLFGQKDEAHLPRIRRFLDHGMAYSKDEVRGVSVRRISEPIPTGPNRVLRREVRIVTDVAMKDYPSEDSSPDYVRGFIEGWLAADGTASDGPDSLHLDSQHPDARRWLDNYAAYGGWVLTGDVTSKVLETNLGVRKNPIHKFTLTRNAQAAWKVISIEPGDVPQPVYCATVPGEGFFTLASGVYTGNTYRQKPYRQRSVDYVVDYAKKLQDNLGSTRMAPFSPDLPMHTQRRRLISELLANVSDEVDAASMRVDDFTADNTFILLQVHGGMDAVTLGVEGNSQRMRDLVGKGTSDAEIKEAVTRGIRSGIRKFKLFMISNLPGEDEGDVYRILKLAKDLADIRDSMGQSTVRIQFSWTPLMIEANTPFQWFAPQPANRILGDVWEDFRDLKIDFKIGAKAEPNKMAFFQLCQRASRDVGEALVDAMIEVDQACWGGVPRTFKDLIEAKLVDHGFQNGYADCFDERYKHDMFGWEFIDQGISNELLWATYVQMREFVEQTDSHTYDLNFGADYRGSEWLVRCNEKCYGKSCGACSYTDLKIRNQYIRAEAQDVDVDLASITTVDQHSQAVRIRAKITKPETLRFVGNDHWRFAFRRACFRAQTRLGLTHGIAKRSIRFASDETKYRDWTAGTDYVEFAFTRPVTDLEIAAFLRNADIALEGRMHIGGWARHPVDAVTIRADVDLTLFDVEIDVDLHTATQRLTAWASTEHVDMRLKIEGGYFAPNSEQVNAKDYVDDLWLLPDGHRLHLRMLIRGRPNPYNITAAVLGKQSWLPFAKHPARRVDVFIATDRHQQDFLRPVCTACGLGIPINLLDQPYHPQFCPRCYDEKSRP
jgi:radical SAM superfamily enzyme YgiQ (UPF0313 family)